MGGEIRSVEAIKILVAWGRVYVSRGGNYSVKVFTKDGRVARLLKETFRGNYYEQGYGLIWALSDKQDLIALANIVRPYRNPRDKLSKLFKWLEKPPPTE